jgi:uncharacterized protein YwqG
MPGKPWTREDVLRLIDEHGLSRVREELDELMRPAIRVHAMATPEDELQVGASKIGGRPDLPPAVEWPVCDCEDYDGVLHRSVPQAFVAQFRLADVAEHDVEGLLPPTGMLHFFYAPWQTVWGDGRQVGRWRVIHWDGDAAALARQDFPDHLPEESRFDACSVELATDMSLPCWESTRVDRLRLSDEEGDGYAELTDRLLQPRGCLTSLLGYATPIQGDVEADCEPAWMSMTREELAAAPDPRAAAREVRWVWRRLLFQLGSEQEAGMMWGDVGMLYYTICEEELNARNFDGVRLEMQCS